MSSADVRRTRLLSQRSTSERLFENTASKEGQGHRLSNFLSLSEHAKSLAHRGIQRRTSQTTSKSSKLSQKNTRRASIFNSLDKFLHENGDDDETQATQSTQHQSSFSSGFSNETTPPQHVSNSLASGKLSRREPQIAEEGEEHITPGNSRPEPTKAHARYRRRGSVTKFALGKEFEKIEPDGHANTCFKSNSSNNDTNEDSFSDLNARRASFSSQNAEEASEHSIDERPVPMKPAPRLSIDSLPLPMKIKMPSNDSRKGRPPLMRRSMGGGSGDLSQASASSAPIPKTKTSGIDDSIHDDVIKPENTRRYRRRGSVTKFSLDDDSQSVLTENTRTSESLETYFSELDDGSGSFLESSFSDAEVRSHQSEVILPKVKLSSRPKTKRSSTARSTSSGAAAGSLAKGLAFLSRQNNVSQNKDQDDTSVASSIGMDSTSSNRRYRRRGSVTKYTLDEDALSLSQNIDDGRSCVSESALNRTTSSRHRKSNKTDSSSGRRSKPSKTRRESSKARSKVLMSKRSNHRRSTTASSDSD